MLRDFIRLLGQVDVFALTVGLAIGIAVIALMRSTQVWRHRSSFGYSAYSADRFRRRMTRVAFAAITIGIIGVFSYVFLWDRGTQPVFFENSTAEETVALQPDEIVGGMSILIPRLAVESELTHAPIVGQEWDISRLRDEVAHLAGTVYPGEPGNVVLAGHVTVPGAGWGPFRELDLLQPGDEIFIEHDGGAYTYIVSEMRVVDPTDIEVAYPTDDDRLTLITCSDWDEEADTYAKRIVIIAYQVPDNQSISASSLQ